METAVAPIIQFPENSSSLVSTGRRLNQYEGFEQEDAEEDADSYEAFRVVYRSQIQIQEQEGVPADERGK